MMTRPDDPRLKALAELIHQLRPAWNRGGILSAIHIASTKLTLDQVCRAGIDAALDPKATTPGVIQHRDGAAWAPPVPKPVERPWDQRPCTSCQRIHDPEQTTCQRSTGDVATRGAAAARRALAEARQ